MRSAAKVGAGEHDMIARAVALGGDEVVAIGTSKSGPGSDRKAWLYVFNAALAGSMQALIGAPGGDLYGEGVAVLPAGGFVVAGWTKGPGTDEKAVLTRTTAGGSVVWQRVYPADNDQRLTAVGVLADGALVAAGMTRAQGEGEYDGWLIRTTAAGVLRWSRTWGAASVDHLYALDVLADGDTALVGVSDAKGPSRTWMLRVGPWGHDSCAAAGSCAQADSATCDDGNPCTYDQCDQGKCSFAPASDGMDCGGGATCVAAKCVL